MKLVRHICMLSLIFFCLNFQIFAQDADIADESVSDVEASIPDADIQVENAKEKTEPEKTVEPEKVEPEKSPEPAIIEPAKPEQEKAKYVKKRNNHHIFTALVKKEQQKNLRGYSNKKAGAAVLMTMGLGVAISGLALAIAGTDLSVSNDELTTQMMMYGGTMAVGLGTFLNFSSEHSLNKSGSFASWLENNNDKQIPQSEYDELTEIKNSAKRKSAKKMREHGAGILFLAAPAFAVSIYSFVRLYKDMEQDFTDHDDKHDRRVTTALVFLSNSMTLIPGIALTVLGSIMIQKSYKWQNLYSENGRLTLNTIAPVINPVSKTYGINLGFSF
ncbi:MAG TPA: hypothetical protein PKG52_08910 [bacterium]|nr:hypothetical protein [bacterium]